MNLKNKWLIGLTSAALITGAASLEGTETDPYRDIAGIPTVCTGHTGKDVVMGKPWTPTQCTEQLKKDLVQHGDGILQCINVPINQNQYNALTLFAFNIGVGAFCKSSTVLKPLNEGRYEDARNGMYKWVYVNGKYSKGLYNRRVKEAAIFNGDYR
jgi:lysozyme